MGETLKQKFMKPAIIAALNKHLGNIAAVCRELNISRQTYYNLTAQDSDFKEAAYEAQEIALDTVEDKLMEAIKEGDTTAIIFYLNNKGKGRGYSYRAGDMNIKFQQEAPKNESEALAGAVALIHKLKTAKPIIKKVKADAIN